MKTMTSKEAIERDIKHHQSVVNALQNALKALTSVGSTGSKGGRKKRQTLKVGATKLRKRFKLNPGTTVSKVYDHISANGPATRTQIAKALGIPMGTASSTLHSLHKRRILVVDSKVGRERAYSAEVKKA